MEVPDRPSKPKAVLSGTSIKVRYLCGSISHHPKDLLHHHHSSSGQNGRHESELISGTCLTRLTMARGLK